MGQVWGAQCLCQACGLGSPVACAAPLGAQCGDAVDRIW